LVADILGFLSSRVNDLMNLQCGRKRDLKPRLRDQIMKIELALASFLAIREVDHQ
jgi:hypothetical protein